jgi:hypothetical protein
MLKKKGSTPDRIESPLPPQLESNDQEIQQSPKPQMRPKSSSSDRLKVSKPKPQSPVVAEEEEGSDLEKSEDEDDENEVDNNDDDHQDQEDRYLLNFISMRKAKFTNSLALSISAHLLLS